MERSKWSVDDFQEAWFFATLAHAGQTYGGPEIGQKVDYLNHIGSVTTEVIRALAETDGMDGDLAVQCALLHDVVEDTPHTIEEIQEKFGHAVAHGVAALTKDETLPDKKAKMEDTLNRIRQQPKEIWMVKLADRISNLQRPPFYWNEEKKREYQEEARMILRMLKGGNAWLEKRLELKIEAYSQFFK